MARTKKTKAPEFDRDAWEYLTYAPGHECSACHRPIGDLEPALRGAIDRTSGAPAPVYRHDKCPARAVAA
ncbi:hypothetical protein K7B10_24415 [Streptomyces flavotricini]|uniref:Uncharacterized protein n=1 Tax=Streptomyces flavotricini TaxID=66888 RepID=A0ABS8EA54_9ACTN|nr:hypothetical protein [Streptomyces flavotricini]MCC0097862.1 hypothetical protein [Streptomyces flavotricini]